jgi:hypothetical protein
MALKRIFVLIAFACLLPKSSAAQHNWALRLGSLSFETGTFGEGQFLAIQNEWNYRSSTLFRSPDGRNWITCSLPPHDILTQVHYGNGLFVAVDFSGTVFTSDDAIHWTTSTVGPVAGFGFRNGTWITFSSLTGYLYASRDFENWTLVSQWPGNAVFGAAENGFVVSTLSGLLVSTNGFDWSHVGTLPVPSTSGVVEGNGTYIVQSSSGVYASTDGTNWVRSGLPAFSTILYGNGHFVAYSGTTWDFGRYIISSRDGITCHSVWVPGIESVIFKGEMFYGLGSHMVASPDGLTWTRVGDTPPGLWVNELLPTDNGLYALQRGFAPITVLHSIDGREWKELFLPLELGAISGIASHENTRVAIGSSGAIAVSTNNISWTIHHKDAAPLKHILYGGGQWIVFGQTPSNSVVLTSSDAHNWTRTPLDRAFSSIAFGNGRFVGVDGSATVQTSTNGTHWQTNTTDQTPQIFEICFGNGVFLGYHPFSSLLYRSNDGVNWEGLRHAPQSMFRDITFHHGKFALATETDAALTTINGDEFETLLLPTSISSFQPSSSAVYSDGDLAVAYGGSLYRFNQTNGLTAQVESRLAFHSPRFCHDRFLAHSGVNIYSSHDGLEWNAAPTPILDEAASGLFAYGHGRWVFFSRGGFAAFSEDAKTWSEAMQNWDKIAYLRRFQSLCFGSSTFLAVGKGGIFATSTNGTSWAIGTPVVSWDIESVAYGNGKFVAIGNSDIALTSTNGRDWISAPIGRSNPSPVTSICFDHRRFVACTMSGEVLTSITGDDWEVQSVGGPFPLSSAGAADDGFYVGDIGGRLYHSKDARDWTALPGTKEAITSISFGNGNLLISDGVIRQRTPALQSTPAINASTITLPAVVEPGRAHKLLSTADFASWQTATNFTPTTPRHDISLDGTTNQHFFRLVAE